MNSKIHVKIILVLILLFASTPGFSQSSTLGGIRGFVVDATSGEPLPIVNVVLQGQFRGSSTNLDGYFVIGNLNPGVYTLEITYVGYHPKTEQIVVTNELANPVHIELTPSSIKLEEVIVFAEESDEIKVRLSPTVSNVSVGVTTLRKIPSIGGENDLLRAIQVIPGVKASSDMSSAIYVRGGGPDQTLILVDHNPVFNPSHMFGLFSTFNADAVKHLDLKKGAFPAYYGGRSGSVLEVISNDGNRKEFEGGATISLISARANIEGPLSNNKGSYSIAGRRTYLEPIIAAMRNATGDDLPDYYFWDGNSKLNLDLTDRTTLTVAGYWGNDILDLTAGPDDARFDLGLMWGNRTLSTRLRTALSRNLFGSVLYSWSRFHSEFNGGSGDVTFIDFYNSFVDHTFRTDLEFLGNEKHKITTGIWVKRNYVHFEAENNDYQMINVKESAYNYSIYIQDNWKPHILFEVQPGIRAYYHDDGDYTRLDARLAMVYHYSNKTRLKLAGGRYTQFINLITYGEGFNSFDMWLPTDDSMDPSYSDQVVLGFEHDPRKDLQFTAETYFTDMHDLAQTDLLSTSADKVSDSFVIGKGWSYGLELMLRKKEGRLTGWLGYSLSWTKRKFPDSFLNNGNVFYPKWDRRHDFMIVSNYALNDRWDLSGTWRYNTGQGYSEAVGLSTIHLAGIDPAYWDNQAQWVMPGEMNNYRFPSDHKLDLTFTYKHNFWGKLPARLNLSVYNVYNRKSYWRRDYDSDFEGTTVENQRSPLGVLPLISYEVRF
ncbi:MAG: TonB-dependent receptor [FCB group bacterium]|nr:TonB-dependent receptor [FCB group bacterium]